MNEPPMKAEAVRDAVLEILRDARPRAEAEIPKVSYGQALPSARDAVRRAIALIAKAQDSHGPGSGPVPRPQPNHVQLRRLNQIKSCFPLGGSNHRWHIGAFDALIARIETVFGGAAA